MFYLFIYLYLYNPHLGLIIAPPPLICVLPKNDLVHYSYTIKHTGNILNVWPRLYEYILRHGRSQLGHLAGHLGGDLGGVQNWIKDLQTIVDICITENRLI